MQGGTTWIHGAYSKTLMDSLKHVKLAGLSNYGCLGLPTFLIFFGYLHVSTLYIHTSYNVLAVQYFMAGESMHADLLSRWRALQ